MQPNLVRDGYVCIAQVVAAQDVAQLRREFDAVVAANPNHAGLSRKGGEVFAVRDLTRVWPDAVRALSWLRAHREVAAMVAGLRLVGATLIDKPASQTWSLPWHRDTAVPIRPTRAGVAGVIRVGGVTKVRADIATLTRMRVVRVHLDDACADNGALEVVPGSHREVDVLGESTTVGSDRQVTICARAGDLTLMSPLTLHRSGAGLGRARRRVLHLEMASPSAPPRAGLEWSFLDSVSDSVSD